MSDERLERVLRSIRRLYEDRSVSLEEALDRLITIREEVQSLIDAAREDLGQ